MREPRRDLEAVAPALAGGGREQPIPATLDLQQRGARAPAGFGFFFFAAEGGGAGGEQRTADARAPGLVGQADEVADAGVQGHGVGGVDVLDAVDLTAGAACGQRRAGRLYGGDRQEHFEREGGELRALKRGDADVVEAVLGGAEGEGSFAVGVGLLAADGGQLRAHGVVHVDRGVERAARGQVECDAMRGGKAHAVPDGVSARNAARRFAFAGFGGGADGGAVDRRRQRADRLGARERVVGRRRRRRRARVDRGRAFSRGSGREHRQGHERQDEHSHQLPSRRRRRARAYPHPSAYYARARRPSVSVPTAREPLRRLGHRLPIVQPRSTAHLL